MHDGAGLHVAVSGPVNGPALLVGPTLGTALALWDDLIAQLPPGLRVIRYDLRGHGQSDLGLDPVTMGQLVRDAETICEAYRVTDAVFLGASEGGLIALGLAAKRPDLLRALVLSATAPKLNHPQGWHAQAGTALARGMAPITDTSVWQMFGEDFYGSAAMPKWLNMMMSTDPEGYAAICRAMAGADLYNPMSGLRMPVLGIAGSNDRKVPPDMMREALSLVPDARFHLMRGAGHLPALEAPDAFADVIIKFLTEIGHFSPTYETA